MKKLIFVIILTLFLTGCAKKPIEETPEIPAENGEESVTPKEQTDGVNYIFIDGHYMGYEHDGEIVRHSENQTTLFCDLLAVDCLYNDKGEKITELYINMNDYSTPHDDIHYGEILKKYASGEEGEYYKFTLPTKLSDDAKKLRVYSTTADFKFGEKGSKYVASLPFTVSMPSETTLTESESAAAKACVADFGELTLSKVYSVDYDGDKNEEKLVTFAEGENLLQLVTLKDGVATHRGSEIAPATLEIVDFGNDGSEELIFSVTEPQYMPVSIYYDMVEVFSEFIPLDVEYMTEEEFLSRLCEKAFGVYDHEWFYIHSDGNKMHLSGSVTFSDIEADTMIFKETFLLIREEYGGGISEVGVASKTQATMWINSQSEWLTPQNVLVDLRRATAVEIGDRRITDATEIKKLTDFFYNMKVTDIEYGVEEKDGETLSVYERSYVSDEDRSKYLELIFDADGFYYNGCRYNVEKGYLKPLLK